MKIQAIRTWKLQPPQDDMYAALQTALPETLPDRSVVVVTSKVVAIHQGRCVPMSLGVERDELVPYEADWYAHREIVPGNHILFTIKDHTLVASAGIDKSNGAEHLILWPNRPTLTAKEIYFWFKKQYGLKEFGVIISDSHVIMMRRGAQGVSIGHYGFAPVRNYVGKPDIFGRLMQFEVGNLPDSLAAAAVLEMGEGEEQTPLAVVTDITDIEFTTNEAVMEGDPSFFIPMAEDLFKPMLDAVEWTKGQGGLTDTQLRKLQAGDPTWKEAA